MKNTVKIILLQIITALLFWGCAKEPVHIGLAKFVAIPSTDALQKTLIDTVQRAYPEVVFDVQDASGDPAALEQIAQTFAGNAELKLRIAISTPTAQALAQHTETPLLYAAVTDPENAGIVAENGQVTGYTDAVPLDLVFSDIIAIMPGMQSLGQIDSRPEADSQIITPMVSYRAAVVGVSSSKTTVINTAAQVGDAASSLVAVEGKVDALYISASDLLTSGLQQIVSVAQANQTPVFSGDAISAAGTGVVYAAGADYEKIGAELAQLVIQFLKQEGDIFSEPVRNLADTGIRYYADQQAAQTYGLEIPAEIMTKVR